MASSSAPPRLLQPWQLLQACALEAGREEGVLSSLQGNHMRPWNSRNLISRPQGSVGGVPVGGAYLHLLQCPQAAPNALGRPPF